MKPLIIYTAASLDGMTAAYVTVRAICGHDIATADFHAARYGDAVPDLTGRVVYIVGFSYHPEALLLEIAKSVSTTVIGQTQSMIDAWVGVNLPTNLFLITNANYSAARLAWVFFNGADPLPTYVALSQDHTLWKYVLEDTKYFVAAMYADGCIQLGNFHEFEYLVKERNINTIIQDGIVLVKERTKVIKLILSTNTSTIVFEGHKVLFANIPYTYASEAGHILAQDAAFSITYDDQLTLGIRKYSLRSNTETGLDVAKIAEKYNGGGSKHSAGFIVRLLKNHSGDMF